MALAQGARKTVWFCAGVIAGDLVWLSLSLGGLALIAQQIPMLFIIIKWAGVAYLVRLAWVAWHSKAELGQTMADSKERGATARVLAGFAVTMGNPKAMLFYLALLPSLVRVEHMSLPVVLPFFLAVIAVLATVLAFYITAAQAARRAMKSARALRGFNRATATALGGAAAWIASR
jgi:threonine/homoserine/homoserine lactone efflux protein